MFPAVHVAGKLSGQGPINAISPGTLLHVQDSLTGVRFLIDTGAAFSVLPFSSPSAPTGPALKGPNGVDIPCWGEENLHLILGGQRFEWIFLKAAVDFAIIGVDFLCYFELSVDVASGCLRGKSRQTVSCTRGPPAEATLRMVRAAPSLQTRKDDDVKVPSGSSVVPGGEKAVAAMPEETRFSPAPTSLPELLARFPEVLNAEGRLPPSTHGVEHFIVTSGPPTSAKFRRLDEEKLKAAKEEFELMEKEGVVRRSSSCWSSLLHMVRKSDGSWRPCGDFRRLNLAMEPDRYPVPNMMDLTSSLAGRTVFSKLDLKKGYHQIPVHAADVPKTAIITPFGLYEFVRMPFGLRNAGMTFQRFMDQVLAGLDHSSAYLDDILVASPDERQHLRDLEDVLSRLSVNGLVLNRGKCEFMRREVDYLGHRVSAEGVAPLKTGVQAILDYPRPTTIKELQGLLGMINFYRRFIPAAAKLLSPLTDVLKGGPSGSTRVEWTPEMVQSSEAARSALANAALLAHPDPAAELALVTDASATHVGAVLQQRASQFSPWQPLSFYSKKLDKPQLKHSAFDRELFAVFAGIRHFRHLLEGRDFKVWSDHKPLTFALHRLSDSWTARQQRQLSYVAEFTSNIIYVPGKDNVVADALSRPPESSTPPAAVAGVSPPPAARPPAARAGVSTTGGFLGTYNLGTYSLGTANLGTYNLGTYILVT